MNLLEQHKDWYIDPSIFFHAIKKFNFRNEIGSLSGLAITSKNREIDDGFGYNLAMHDNRGYNLQEAKKRKVYHWIDYNQPTTLCNGKIKVLFDFLKKHKLQPTRLRLSFLDKNSNIPLHNDAVSPNQYCMKLHVPIITNSKCITIMDDREFIMEEGKVYLFNANSQHAVINGDISYRWHFICDVYDEKGNFSFGLCRNYKYHQKIAKKWRDVVDGKIFIKYLPIDS